MKRFLCGFVGLGLLVGGVGQAKADYILTPIDVPRTDYLNVSGINDAGQVVGWYESDRVHGFIFSGGVFTALEAGYNTYPTGINSSGQIVGAYGLTIGQRHGFLFDGGTFTTFDVPGSNITFPRGINASGQIVGYTGGFQGFLLSGGSYTLHVPGSYWTLPWGINSSGQIVGYYNEQSGGNQHGFLLSGGSYTTLDMPGAAATVLYGINDSGQIVGDSSLGPFLLSDGIYTKLDLPGGVTGINNVGQVVGVYYAHEEFHGYLATPVPESSTLLLLTIGTLGLIVWAWRRGKIAGTDSHMSAKV